MKTFATQQLRLAGLLLTGNPSDGANGTLWYNEQKLAIGSNAAEQGRQILPGSGLYGLQNTVLLYEEASFKADAADPDFADLQTDFELHISGRSGIATELDFIYIPKVSVENIQLVNDSVSVQAGIGLGGGTTAVAGNAPLELGGDTTLNTIVDSNVSSTTQKTIDVGSTDNDLRVHAGIAATFTNNVIDNVTPRSLQGLQETHLASINWARGASDGDDALAVEHHLSKGLNMVLTDLDGTSTTTFDGAANMSLNVIKQGANQVCISGERQWNDPGRTEPNSNHELQVFGGSKEWEDDAVFNGDVEILGAITVAGDVIQVDSNHVNIGDNIIVLNSDLGGVAENNPTQNGGIDVRLGQLEGTSVGLLGGPARIWFNTSSSVRAWQAGNVLNWGGSEDYSDMWTIHTQKYSRVFTVACTKDDSHLHNATNAAGDEVVDFAVALDAQATAGTYEFPAVPNVVASLTYTGTAAEPEQVSWVVKDVTTSGLKLDFSDGIPAIHYDMKLFISTL